MTPADHLPVVPRNPRSWVAADLDDGDWIRHWDRGLLDDQDALAALAAEIGHELLHGRGFVLLRGLDPAPDEDELGQILIDLGQRVGALRSQNAAGDLLGQVRDVGRSSLDPTARIYQTNERQTFHTDSSDAVVLGCIRPALSGGRSMLVSAETIYEQMRRNTPELARWLFEPVATDRRGEIPPGANPWFEIPVLSWFAGQLTVLYQRQYIDSAARFDDAPRLHPDHRAALDEFDRLANDPELHIVMDLEPGDIQFVHNHGLLHDRTGWTDDPAAPRHLLRLWLSLPGDRALPEVFAQRYGSLEIGNRGGIVVAAPQ